MTSERYDALRYGHANVCRVNARFEFKLIQDVLAQC
jgi:hypothetical protein